MIKVFLVEDETVVREGIKKIINWEKEGLQLVGAVSNGELALPLIRKEQPDILITDIKMPFMDGLQLSKIVKEEMPWIKIIIVSGYSEFDYVKEAISIGVTEYLLKPIGSIELLDKISHICSLIRVEQSKKEMQESNMMELNQSGRLKRHQFLYLVAGDEIDIFNVDREDLESFIKTGMKSEVNNFIEKYFENINENNLTLNVYFQYIVIEILKCCKNLLVTLGYSYTILFESDENHKKITSKSASLKEVKKALSYIILTTMDFRDNCSKDKYADMIIAAKEYINAKYSRKDITLNSVADHVKMSPSYFSVIFKQVTGQNFIDYVTLTRMKNAKELLCCTSRKVADVGMAVGYKDSHYFITLFKKTEGCTPKEFRLKRQS